MKLLNRVAVRRCGEDVLRRFKAAPHEAGSVHSVFDRVLNLAWHDGHLLTLQGPGRLVAPFAAELTGLPGSGVLAGGCVRRLDDMLALDGLTVDWRAAVAADTAMPKGAAAGNAMLSGVLSECSAPAAPALSSVTGLRARARIAEGLSRHLPDLFIEGVCGLVGLGEGLTPAGDDCVVGVLAVIHRLAPAWLRQHPWIAASIAARAAAATTTIAGEFLTHGLAGRFAEPVIELLTGCTADTIERAAARLLRMGATSGADTLVGVRLALSALPRAEDVPPSAPRQTTIFDRPGAR
jgi:Protein of unknown function (DUF2877)